MKRRSFILFTAAAIITFYLPTTSCTLKSNSENILANPKSLSSIMNLNLIKSIGKKYLISSPIENKKSTLESILLNGKVLTNKSKIQNFLFTKIRIDYQKENIVIINGWVISKTEARQCALSSIINT